MSQRIRKFAVAVASIALVTACAGGDADGDSTIADTTVMPGMDTINVPTAVPTTDTLVTSKQISTDTNVIRGEGRDTTRRNP